VRNGSRFTPVSRRTLPNWNPNQTPWKRSAGCVAISSEPIPNVQRVSGASGRQNSPSLTIWIDPSAPTSLPLYRQAKAYRRAGVEVDDSTLGQLFHRAAEATKPLSKRLLQLVSEKEIVQADETTQRV
jgi:hypothetical protein